MTARQGETVEGMTLKWPTKGILGLKALCFLRAHIWFSSIHCQIGNYLIPN